MANPDVSPDFASENLSLPGRNWSMWLAACVVLVSGCGGPPDAGPANDDPVTTSSNAGDVVSTTTTWDTTGIDAPGVFLTIDDIDLPSPIPIDAPADFPEVAELSGLVNGAIYDQPHPRAGVMTALVVSGDPSELQGSGLEPNTWITPMTIFDGIIVWDYASGSRQVYDPESTYYLLTDDNGTWTSEHADEEWSFFTEGFHGWKDAQVLAVDFLEFSTLAGFDEIAGTETAHFTGVHDGDQQERTRAEIWIDKQGAVFRLYWIVESDSQVGIAFVWNVETLEPTLSGPLPIDP